MTRYRAIIIHIAGVHYYDFGEDVCKAEQLEFIMRDRYSEDPVEITTIGDVNGDEHISIYRIKGGQM